MKRVSIISAILLATLVSVAQTKKVYNPLEQTVLARNITLKGQKADLQIDVRWQGVWPRLLMDAKEISDLRVRLAAEPILRQAAIPTTQMQPNLSANGSIELTPELAKLERASFFWRVTGDERFRQTVASFLPLVEKVTAMPVTLHTGPNAHDLNAGFTLRWLALTYDWLHDSWPARELDPLRKALICEANTVYEEMLGYRDFTYDQNHGYIPVVGLGLAGLVLWGEDEHATTWSSYARTYMDRSTRVLGSDGFYYEGPAYYSYAFEWQTLYSVVLLRLTGEDWTSRPIFQNLEKYIAHCTLPGHSFVFDFGDWGSYKGQKYYGIPWEDRVTLTGSNASRMNLAPLLALERYSERNECRSSVIDWLLTGTTPVDLTVLGMRPFPFTPKDPDVAVLPTSYYFPDSEALFWRSSWSDPNATAVMFKCGPPHGHHAAPLVEEFPNWRENSGHVHPDAGQFLIWSHGKFIAGDTGYTGKKYTREHNSLLIDGQGQWQDGRYHVYQNLNYGRLNQLRLENIWHNDEVMAATAVLDSGYNPDMKLQLVRRHFLLVAGKWLLIHDVVISPEPRTVSWLWHTEQQIVTCGTYRWYLTNGEANATLIALTPPEKTLIEPTIVLAYGGVPESGEPKQRGWSISLISPKSTKSSLWHAIVLNTASAKFVTAEQISDSEVRLRDGKEEAILGIVPTAEGRIIWNYRINNGVKKIH
jgi:hypothetical protein